LLRLSSKSSSSSSFNCSSAKDEPNAAATGDWLS
jgi:hypothetical protein